MNFTAVVLAGARPGGDDFARQFGTDMKALIEIAGEPMVSRPVRALLDSGCIGELIVAAQAPERVAEVIPQDPRIRFRQSRGTIAATMLELLDDPSIKWPVLVTTADHALLDGDIVDQFARKARRADVAIGVVEKANLLARLPGTERTWLQFRRASYTGANLFALASPKVRPAIELWRSVEQDRKKAWRVISLLGPLMTLAVAMRIVSLERVMSQLSDRLGLEIRAITLSNPLAGVDVDKAADHNLVEAILAGEA